MKNDMNLANTYEPCLIEAASEATTIAYDRDLDKAVRAWNEAAEAGKPSLPSDPIESLERVVTGLTARLIRLEVTAERKAEPKAARPRGKPKAESVAERKARHAVERAADREARRLAKAAEREARKAEWRASVASPAKAAPKRKRKAASPAARKAAPVSTSLAEARQDAADWRGFAEALGSEAAEAARACRCADPDAVVVSRSTAAAASVIVGEHEAACKARAARGGRKAAREAEAERMAAAWVRKGLRDALRA